MLLTILKEQAVCVLKALESLPPGTGKEQKEVCGCQPSPGRPPRRHTLRGGRQLRLSPPDLGLPPRVHGQGRGSELTPTPRTQPRQIKRFNTTKRGTQGNPIMQLCLLISVIGVSLRNKDQNNLLCFPGLLQSAFTAPCRRPWAHTPPRAAGTRSLQPRVHQPPFIPGSRRTRADPCGGAAGAPG